MGIRFLCDSCGKKLNIKQELAGKKGRCPKCDAVIKIPAQSLPDGTAPSDPAAAEFPSASASAGPPDDDSPRHDGPVESAQPSETKPPELPGNAEISVEPPAIQFVDQSSSDGVEPPTPEPPQTVSPLQEDPDAKWFVRPSSGGQFGPAEAAVMKNWLSEGRIGRDSLVWREGWEEWQPATEVFVAELGDQPETSAGKLIEKSIEKDSNPTLNRVHNHRQARQRAKTMGIILVVGLALVSVALAVTLVYVVNNAGKKGENKEANDKNESALLYFDLRKNHNQLKLAVSDFADLSFPLSGGDSRS